MTDLINDFPLHAGTGLLHDWSGGIEQALPEHDRDAGAPESVLESAD